MRHPAIEAMLAELDAWLRRHRADYYAALRDPATLFELKLIESLSGFPLPSGLRSLLLWKDGQPNDDNSSFHPLTNEMFMSSAEICKTMRLMDDLARGDIPRWAWKTHWVPFMDNGNGDLSVIDSKTGEVRFFEHEGLK